MMFIIRTIPGTQLRDFYIKVGTKTHHNLKWTPEIGQACKFLSKEVAEKQLIVANRWCKCEIVDFKILNQDFKSSSPEDDYDRAMGIIK